MSWDTRTLFFPERKRGRWKTLITGEPSLIDCQNWILVTERIHVISDAKQDKFWKRKDTAEFYAQESWCSSSSPQLASASPNGLCSGMQIHSLLLYRFPLTSILLSSSYPECDQCRKFSFPLGLRTDSFYHFSSVICVLRSHPTVDKYKLN